MVTSYEAILNKIRELSFDRFITPTFFIAHRSKLAWTFQVTSTSLVITDTVSDPDVAHTFLFATYPTLDSLLKRIIEVLSDSVEIIYSGSYIPSEASNSLMLQSPISLSTYRPIFRKYYFSDAYINKYLNEYAYMRLGATHERVDTINWQTEMSSIDFTNDMQEHVALWVAYHLVGQRRLYELAGQQLQQSTLGGIPNAYNGLINWQSFSMEAPGQKLDVRIGDVFTLSDDSGNSLNIANGGDIPKDMIPPWGVGTDNELMDYYSFWYRLQLWLRNRLEFLFGDQSLRKDTVVHGQMYLDKYSSRNWHSWFESYPWAWYSPNRSTRSRL